MVSDSMRRHLRLGGIALLLVSGGVLWLVLSDGALPERSQGARGGTHGGDANAQGLTYVGPGSRDAVAATEQPITSSESPAQFTQPWDFVPGGDGLVMQRSLQWESDVYVPRGFLPIDEELQGADLSTLTRDSAEDYFYGKYLPDGASLASAIAESYEHSVFQSDLDKLATSTDLRDIELVDQAERVMAQFGERLGELSVALQPHFAAEFERHKQARTGIVFMHGEEVPKRRDLHGYVYSQYVSIGPWYIAFECDVQRDQFVDELMRAMETLKRERDQQIGITLQKW